MRLPLTHRRNPPSRRVPLWVILVAVVTEASIILGFMASQYNGGRDFSPATKIGMSLGAQGSPIISIDLCPHESIMHVSVEAMDSTFSTTHGVFWKIANVEGRTGPTTIAYGTVPSGFIVERGPQPLRPLSRYIAVVLGTTAASPYFEADFDMSQLRHHSIFVPGLSLFGNNAHVSQHAFYSIQPRMCMLQKEYLKYGPGG